MRTRGEDGSHARLAWCVGKKGEERVGDPVRILVADDEQNLCRILVARLTRDGYLCGSRA